MVKSECLLRVFYLQVPINATTASQGSCFTIESSENLAQIMRQYVITARHIFEDVGYPSKHCVSLLISQKLQSFTANIYYHTNPNVDIAVMEIGTYTSPFVQNQQFSTADIAWGQDVFILGFPSGFVGALPNYPQSNGSTGNKIPMIARSCLSTMINEGGVSHLCLDGHNNKGFSGGPVCFYHKGVISKQMCIAGVVKGFNTNQYPVHFGKPNPLTNRFDRVGDLIHDDSDGKQYPCFIENNSGIFWATDIRHAHEIIKTIP